jgi:hypothetical protein
MHAPAAPEPAPGRPRSIAVRLAVSVLLVAPCFWQPRIQAGDLSSHIYNSWLAQLIESGRTEGLALARQSTNVLFDLILARFYAAFGAEAAQRIAVSAAVIVFCWGAFAFVSRAGRRRAWRLLPCVAMFAYGWVFHMGFFNFYLAMGLALWAMATAWKGDAKGIATAAVLLAAASTAHALPVAWAASLIAYLAVARRIAPRRRVLLCAFSLCLIAGAHFFLAHGFVTRWSPQQFSLSTGADQMWVFGSKYYLILLGVLLFWGMLFLDLVHQRGALRIVLDIPFQFCVLSAVCVIALPSAILLPGYDHALVYVAERMSLGVGVCVCAMLGPVRPKLWERAGIAALATVFFCFLYFDERALNRFETEMENVVAGLPAGTRVVSGVSDTTSRGNALAHVVDRVCIGHCFSYANYEPSTAQFRVRVTGPNPHVAHTYADSYALQTGAYIVRETDPPLTKIGLGAGGQLIVTPLEVGKPCGTTSYNPFPKWIGPLRDSAQLASWRRTADSL